MSALNDLPFDDMIEFGAKGVVYVGVGAAAATVYVARKVYNSIDFHKTTSSSTSHTTKKTKGSIPYVNLPKAFKKYAHPILPTYTSLVANNVLDLITAYTSHRVDYTLSESELSFSAERKYALSGAPINYQYDSSSRRDNEIKHIGVSSFYDLYNTLHYGIIIKTTSEASLLRLQYILRMKGVLKLELSHQRKNSSIGFICSANDTRELNLCLGLLIKHNRFFDICKRADNSIFSKHIDDSLFLLLERINPYPFQATTFDISQKNDFNLRMKKDSPPGIIQAIELSQNPDSSTLWRFILSFASRASLDEYNRYLHTLQIFGLKVEETLSKNPKGIFELKSNDYSEVFEFQHFMHQLRRKNDFRKTYDDFLCNCSYRLGDFTKL